MEIEGEDAIGACRRHQVRDELRRNRCARAGFPVLPRIAEIGDHRRDAPRRRAPERVLDDQQFHQVVVGGVGGRLDHEHVLAAHVLLDFDEDFHVRKAADDRFGKGQVQVGGDGFGKRPVGIARYEFHSETPATT